MTNAARKRINHDALHAPKDYHRSQGRSAAEQRRSYILEGLRAGWSRLGPILSFVRGAGVECSEEQARAALAQLQRSGKIYVQPGTGEDSYFLTKR